MIKKIGLSFLTLSLLTTGLFAKADQALVEEYMNLSGAKITIESLGEQISANLKQSSMMFGTSIDSKKIEFIQEAFEPNESIDVVTTYLIENFDNDELKEIIAYYKTPLGAKITQAAIDAMDPDAQSKMLHFMANMSQNPPSQERIQTIKNFISELHLVETSNTVLKELLYFIAQEASGDKKISKAEVDQLLPMLSQQLEQQLFLSSIYTYRDISSADIKKVISFYHTQEGEDELEIVNAAIKKMLKKGFARAMHK